MLFSKLHVCNGNLEKCRSDRRSCDFSDKNAVLDNSQFRGDTLDEGQSVTMTAVYRPEQALFSAQVGASYAAPYLGRLQDLGKEGFAVIGQMQNLLERYAPHPTRLLVASVRTREAVLDLLKLGVGSLTLPPALFAELLEVSETTAAAATFSQDAQSLT